MAMYYHSSTDAAPSRDWFTSLVRLRQRTRRAGRGYWFPLVVFGCVTLGATPFYILSDFPSTPAGSNGGFSTSAGNIVGSMFRPVGPIDAFAPQPAFLTSGAASWYWLIALPSGFMATGLYYRWRRRRLGFATRAWPCATSGLVSISLVLATDDYFRPMLHLPAWLALRTWNADVYAGGLVALLVIAVGLCILAVTERSLLLAAVSLVYTYIAWKANTYTFANTASRAGFDVPYRAVTLLNLAVPGLLLVTAGVASGVAAYRRRVASH